VGKKLMVLHRVDSIIPLEVINIKETVLLKEKIYDEKKKCNKAKKKPK
jgi:hypothetical protein